MMFKKNKNLLKVSILSAVVCVSSVYGSDGKSEASDQASSSDAVLDLSGKELKEIPFPIDSALKLLYVNDNQLTALPPAIGTLTSLRELHLMVNQLKSLPKEIGNLVVLQELFLSWNQLTEIPPAIGTLTSLRFLNLSGNQLKSLPKEMGNLTAMEVLELDGNQLTSLPKEMVDLTALRHLHLQDNPFSNEAMITIKQLPEKLKDVFVFVTLGPFVFKLDSNSCNYLC